MQTSTKPYLYYEQIINGLVDVPKRIQKYVGDAIILKNEQRKAAAEKTLEVEPPPEDAESNNTGLFKFPLFGWLSSLSAKKTDSDSESNSEKEVEATPEDSSLSNEQQSDSTLSQNTMSSEKTPSEEAMSEKTPSEETLSEKTPSEEAKSERTPSEERTCNIRNWQKLKVE
jgi:hypothetical protein